MISKPKYYDSCHHNRYRDRFLGSFEITEYGGATYDVYVYQDNEESAEFPDMHVCIRYGARGSEYISPGSVDEFIARMNGEIDPIYAVALPLILAWKASL